MPLRLSLGCILIASPFFFLGCASYQNHVEGAREALQSGRYEQAIATLREKVESSNGDQLAYILELGTVLHESGQYEESNKVFTKADKIAELNDYTSVSREAGAMVVQEGLVQYKAEIYEYLLITVYKALNYIMLGDYENAQVMARKLSEKINKVSVEIDKETMKRQTSFAAYLAGLMREAQGDWDNAFVMYNKAHEMAPEVDVFKRDSLNAAKRSGRETDYLRLKKKWPQIDQELDTKDLKNKGEFVFIFQQGWIARKQTRPENKTFPMMVPIPKSIGSVDVFVENRSVHSEKVYDLDLISIQSMDAVFSKLVARAVARQASRIAVRETSRNNEKNSALAIASLATYVFEAMDTADLRQWSTLPASFQVSRLYLPPGKHHIKVKGYKSETTIWEGEITLQANKKYFMTKRAF